MPDVDEMALVREYAGRNSESAFAEIVRRHVSLVYSVALRWVGNVEDAQDVTQAVFIILAQKAGSLRQGTILTGWLYETTRFTAMRFLRTKARRANREQEACMQSIITDADSESVWRQLAPFLEEATTRLGEKERTLLALRFFENRSSAETAAILGIEEAAARKRATRAVEKLRRFFAKRGVVFSASVLAAAISAHSVQAAPAALAGSVTVIAIGKGAAVSGSASILIKGALKAMAWAKVKFACGIGAAVLLAGSVVMLATTDTNSGSPDPLALLKKVAAAREKIKSGEMEFLMANHDSEFHIKTNYCLLKVAFDGEKRRFEQMERESTYVSMDDKVNKLVDAKRKELGGDDDALAKLGLITLRDAHYRTIYDGSAITRFQPELGQVNIHDPKEGSWTYLADPRTLGLSDAHFPQDTVDTCLAFSNAQSVSMMGKETVGDIVAWHIKVQVRDDWRYEFWIDASHPTHVVKQTDPNRDGMALSKFDDKQPNDPIPVEVNYIDHAGGDPHPWETRMIRRNTRYNVPIDPKAWTLAGLGMPIGTPVVDARLMRWIGYWNGTNLSDKFPRNAPPKPREEPAIFQNTPESFANVVTDGSFIDKRKIVVQRTELGVVWFAGIFFTAMGIRHFWTLRRRTAPQTELDEVG